MNPSPEIYLAPLQGVFNYHFRRVLSRHASGFSKYFTPFVRTNGLDVYESRDLREISESRDCPVMTIPQVMGHDPQLLVKLCCRIQEMGFSEINLNMGCPYPMVTKKRMGAGVLQHPGLIDQTLEALCSMPGVAISVKMRLGMEDKRELDEIVPVLNRYPLHEVILHPRIGKQMYKGSADTEAFAVNHPRITAPVVYNGDIISPVSFCEMQQLFPQTDRWMIGRGVAANPFLAENIKAESDFDRKRFALFYDDLLEEYASSYTGGEMQTILKMQEHWVYFITNFPGKEKQLKALKKCKKMADLKSISRDIIVE